MITSPEVSAAQPTIEQGFDRYIRTYNDTTTWFAEVLDGSMRTPFEYSYQGGELFAADGSALGPIFEDALREADTIATQNTRLGFEKRRRTLEKQEYTEMLEMAQGSRANTMIVVSDFPEELMHATEDVGGYNTARKQTMLRVIYWQDDRMHMLSQSLDGSDRQALEALYTACGKEPAEGELLGQRMHVELSAEDQSLLIDKLTGVYDRELQRQYGGAWYAGRQDTRRDTYAFVRSQHDLIDRYVSAEQAGTLTESERYNFAAALQKRYDREKTSAVMSNGSQVAQLALAGLFQPPNIETELLRAGTQARLQGKSFSGCGSSVRAGESEASGLAAEDQLSELGYGNGETDSSEDKYGPLTFKCTEGHTNHRKRGELLKECQTKGCKKGSVGCG